MSSDEFSLHQAYFALTGNQPEAAMQRWALGMAAAFNGPMKRRDNRTFKPDDFAPTDPWAAHADWPPVAPRAAIKAKGKAAGKAPMMAPDFSHLRGMRVGNKRR